MALQLPEWLRNKAMLRPASGPAAGSGEIPRVLPFEPVILACAVFLMLTGFVMITSASLDVALEKTGSAYFYMIRQGIFMLIAIIGALVVFSIPVRFWLQTGHWWVLAAGLLLLAVLVPGIGRSVNGSQRWIGFGPINLQPSEIAKFCMVVFMSGYLVRRLDEVRSGWKGVMKPAFPLGVFVILLYLEPDFGALVVLLGTVMGMIFLSGMKARHFFIVAGGALSLVAIFVGLQPYRLARLQSFLDPWADPFGKGYQLSQAQIAFGRGEWTGTGLGNSVQKLFYLPEAHTDFVFSVLAEETGLLGAIVVLCVYGVMVLKMFELGRKAEQMKAFFMAYIVYGFAIIFAGQALINIGVNSGALPTKGLTLPLVSYGGSSLLVSCAMLALVLRIDFELKQLQQATLKTGKQT